MSEGLDGIYDMLYDISHELETVWKELETANMLKIIEILLQYRKSPMFHSLQMILLNTLDNVSKTKLRQIIENLSG